MKITIEIDDNIDPMVAESLFAAARDGLNDRANQLKARANGKLVALEEAVAIMKNEEDRSTVMKQCARRLAEVKAIHSTFEAVSDAVRLVSFKILQELGRRPQ